MKLIARLVGQPVVQADVVPPDVVVLAAALRVPLSLVYILRKMTLFRFSMTRRCFQVTIHVNHRFSHYYRISNKKAPLMLLGCALEPALLGGAHWLLPCTGVKLLRVAQRLIP